MKLKFTTQDWRNHLKAYDFPELNEWLFNQTKDGVEYFQDRLDMLGFTGGRVLDAGCGAGNWAIALSQAFEQVEAVDTDPKRLSIVADMAPKLGNLNARFGSTEVLEFPDSDFDAVFCSGVIFITDIQKTLPEFVRVLRNGGELYMSFVGSAWWRHLLNERGLTEPSCIKFGADGLLSQFFRRLDEIGLSTEFSAEGKATVAKMLGELYPPKGMKFLDKPANVFVRFAANEDALTADHAVELLDMLDSELARLRKTALEQRRAFEARKLLSDLRQPQVPESYRTRILRDAISRALCGKPSFNFDVHTYTYEPEDMSELLASFGFGDIQIASEGCLRLNPDSRQAKPLYDRRLGVYEVLCRKV